MIERFSIPQSSSLFRFTTFCHRISSMPTLHSEIQTVPSHSRTHWPELKNLLIFHTYDDTLNTNIISDVCTNTIAGQKFHFFILWLLVVGKSCNDVQSSPYVTMAFKIIKSMHFGVSYGWKRNYVWDCCVKNCWWIYFVIDYLLYWLGSWQIGWIGGMIECLVGLICYLLRRLSHVVQIMPALIKINTRLTSPTKVKIEIGNCGKIGKFNDVKE